MSLFTESIFTEFPAFSMFAISCNAPFLSPEVIKEENFQNDFSLLVLLQQYNLFSIRPICLTFIKKISAVTNSNIQTHPTLNVYPHKVIQACIIYLLNKLSEITKEE